MDKIIEDFEKFKIPKEDIPSYVNPYHFASSFKRCTIYEYGNISYSNNTSEDIKSKTESPEKK